MYQLALYGKGGIGKSTMAANISVALAKKGKRVMQVGCDPKHDSTRLLLEGRAQPTVLEYVRSTPLGKRKLEDLIMEGTDGVLCTEAGGPEPGIGCAGRGILTTFDTLKKLGADKLDVDMKIYDVLGDVVCGGFAVPLRGEYADGIILVTSGEFMAMYAANNIMKGLGNFDTGSPRLIGIILNSRGVEGEEETVRRFAAATGTEVIAVMPRDRLFAEAEGRGHTVRELFPDSRISSEIDSIAQRIIDVSEGKCQCVYPHPLDDDQLSDLAAGREIRPGKDCGEQRTTCDGCTGCRRTSIKDTRIMMSCAAYGALAAYMKLTDFAVVLHGPESCLYFMDTSRSKAVLELYDRDLFETVPTHNIRCTMMDDAVSIFGGTKYLEKALRDTIDDGFNRIAVVTTCMPGIIGDDCISVIDRIMKENPGVEIQYVPADGDITGEYTDGFMLATSNIVQMIDTDVKPEKDLINLIGTSFFDLHSKKHMEELDSMLDRFGIRVNCRFIDETDSERIRNFCRGSIDIMLNDTANNRELYDMISQRTGRELFMQTIPVGLYDYENWLDRIGSITGKTREAEEEIRRAEKEYDDFIAAHRHRFDGKRIILVSRISSNIDWLIDLLLDLGADLVKVACQTSGRKNGVNVVSRHADIITQNYESEDLKEDIRTLRPDLIISDVNRPSEDVRFARVGKVGLGLRPTLDYVEYLENIIRLPNDEGWKKGGII
ncbi:nitrogenase iron protein NifH [methanogenic archaeon mixed culture ISO4-G1]|nr:nitrogenase iron protein NifH [methanogenic archaeon mixed culture ISO4-G1]